MTVALSAAVFVFILGFFISHVYAFWDSRRFPWFSPVHIHFQYWQQFHYCITITIIFSLLTFLFAFLHETNLSLLL